MFTDNNGDEVPQRPDMYAYIAHKNDLMFSMSINTQSFEIVKDNIIEDYNIFGSFIFEKRLKQNCSHITLLATFEIIKGQMKCWINDEPYEHIDCNVQYDVIKKQTVLKTISLTLTPKQMIWCQSKIIECIV